MDIKDPDALNKMPTPPGETSTPKAKSSFAPILFILLIIILCGAYLLYQNF